MGDFLCDSFDRNHRVSAIGTGAEQVVLSRESAIYVSQIPRVAVEGIQNRSGLMLLRHCTFPNEYVLADEAKWTLL